MNKEIIHILKALIFIILLISILLFTSNIIRSKPREEINTVKRIDPPKKVTYKFSNNLNGKKLFFENCAGCHNIFQKMSGPELMGFSGRAPWRNRENLYSYLKNPKKFIASNKYMRDLNKEYGSISKPAFPLLTHDEIDAICDYIDYSVNEKSY